MPYVNHVIEVAHLVAEAGGTPEMVAAALLHDTVEDTEATETTIAAAFGPCIATLVAGLTDAPEWKALPREARKRKQAEHMARAPRAIRRIKIADQTSNVRDVGRLPKGWEAGEARAYIAGAALVVDACRGADAGLEAVRRSAGRDARHARCRRQGRTVMLADFILGIIAGAGAPYAEPRIRKALEGMLLSDAPMTAMELRLVSFAICLVGAAILAHIFGEGEALALALGSVVGVFGPRILDRSRNARRPTTGPIPTRSDP